MSARVYLEKSAVGGSTKLAIDVTKVQEYLQNNLLKISIPSVSADKQNITIPITKVRDMKRIEYAYTIEGYISKQTSISGVGAYLLPGYDANIKVRGVTDTLTAAQAKNAMIYYLLYTGSITGTTLNLYWRGLPSSTATPATVLSSLMDATDTNRTTEVFWEKVTFDDAPGLRKDYKYTTTGTPIYDVNESNAEKYNFTLVLTKAKDF